MRVGVTRVLAFIPSVLMNRQSPIRPVVQVLNSGVGDFLFRTYRALPEELNREVADAGGGGGVAGARGAGPRELANPPVAGVGAQRAPASPRQCSLTVRLNRYRSVI